MAVNWHGAILGNISAVACSKRGNKQESLVMTACFPVKKIVTQFFVCCLWGWYLSVLFYSSSASLLSAQTFSFV